MFYKDLINPFTSVAMVFAGSLLVLGFIWLRRRRKASRASEAADGETKVAPRPITPSGAFFVVGVVTLCVSGLTWWAASELLKPKPGKPRTVHFAKSRHSQPYNTYLAWNPPQPGMSSRPAPKGDTKAGNHGMLVAYVLYFTGLFLVIFTLAAMILRREKEKKKAAAAKQLIKDSAT